MSTELIPTLGVAVRLASIAIHAEEFLSPGAHPFDADAIQALLHDQEVLDYLTMLDGQGLLPKKRGAT